MLADTENFRPQGRLPLDPFKITEAGASLGGAGTEKEKTRRKPGWTVKEGDLQDIWTKHESEEGKVVMVLGEPTAKDLNPLLSSQLLSKSLVILATERPPSDLASISPKSTGPALLVLRLQPLPHPIPQHTHSILSRAEILARKWRQDPYSIFCDPQDERGRSRFRRVSKSNSDEVQIKTVQLSEIGGVFGRDFVVREEIGSNPSMINATAFPSPKSPSNQTKPSRTRLPAFTSSSLPKKGREQRALDVIINFVPFTGFHEEGQESAFMRSISSVSSSSRVFLTPPASTLNSSGAHRRRSRSRSSRSRSSSLDRVKDWVRNRSRSRSRNQENSEKHIRSFSSNANAKSNAVGLQSQRRVSDSLDRGAAQAGPSDVEKGKGKAVGNFRRDNARDSTTRTEHGVLTSWSRTRLDQANRVARAQGDPDGISAMVDPEGSKAYLIHVLPLSPPTPSPALLQTSFSQGGLGDIRSQGSFGSVLSSAGTEIPPLGASHDNLEELKDNGDFRAVPPAQRPESVVSSIALGATHNRSGSVESTAFFARSSSARSLPTFQSALLLGDETKTPSTTENTSRIEESEASSWKAPEKTFSANFHDNDSGVSPSSQKSLNQFKVPVYRRISFISPAVEAAVENATRHSLHARVGREMSRPISRKDMQLQRRSTALQVASAAAIAAMEVNLTEAHKNHSLNSDIDETPVTDPHVVHDNINSGGKLERDTDDPEPGNEDHYGQSTLSMDIPEALMPHPHRQMSSLVLPESAFHPLDIDALFQICSLEFEGTLASCPTPISLLPSPHARARTQSPDRPVRSPSNPDISSSVSIVTPPSTASFSIPTLSATNPDFYYERTDFVQELEQFVLSYSYADSSSSIASIPTLPKGAVKPATTGSPSPTKLKNKNSVDKSPMNSLNPSIQKDLAPASFLLPQGLLELSFKLTSSFPDFSRISIVDLILHGLLDPTPESLTLYRDAIFLANKMSPGFPTDGRGNVTLNELLALGALSGEEGGVAHSMPRAWIGGVADIDIENAVPETSQCHSRISVDGRSSTAEGLPSGASVAGSHSPVPPIVSSIFSKPMLSAVSLHSQTVALSLKEQCASQPGSPHLDVIGIQDKGENGWKELGSETVYTEKEKNRYEPVAFELSAHKINRAHTTIAAPHTSHTTVALDTAPTKSTLNRTATAPELSSLHHMDALKPTRSFIPPGAALPINPHLPNPYSAFPRHSVMFMAPPSHTYLFHQEQRPTELSPSSDVDSVDDADSYVEADDATKEITDAYEGGSEHMSGTSISSNPNLEGAIPLASLSSPLLGSSQSSLSGTVATSKIFSDEADILPFQAEPKVTVHAVSISDDTSALVDSPPTASLLIPEPLLTFNATPVSSFKFPPSDSPSTPTISKIPSDIMKQSEVTYTIEAANLASVSQSNLRSIPATTSHVVDGPRNSKLWIQRSPKHSEPATPPESPRRGYFGGIAAPEERRNSRNSLIGESMFSQFSSVNKSPDTTENLLDLPHIGVRRRSTMPKEGSLTMPGLEGDAVDTGTVRKKPNRLSRAISWMVTDADSGPTYRLEVDDVDFEEGRRSGGSSQTGSPVKTFFTNLVASASSTSLLNFSDRGRRLSTSSSSVKSCIVDADTRASAVSISTPDTHSSPVPTTVVTPTSSPLLSILSLPLNNLSTRPDTPPGRPLIISDSTPNSTCSTTPPSSVNAGVRQRLLAVSSPNLSRRSSGGAAPVGPRPPKRGGSLRTTSPTLSLESAESTQSQPVTSPISSRPLPIPAPVSVLHTESVNTIINSGIEEDGAENLITPFPVPLSADDSNHQDLGKSSTTVSRPQSRGGTPTSFSPLRKLAIDEVPLRTRVPRIAMPVGKASRPSSVAGVGNIGTAGSSSKAKWKFWGNGSGSRPVSMTVDLTREI